MARGQISGVPHSPFKEHEAKQTFHAKYTIHLLKIVVPRKPSREVRKKNIDCCISADEVNRGKNKLLWLAKRNNIAETLVMNRKNNK